MNGRKDVTAVLNELAKEAKLVVDEGFSSGRFKPTIAAYFRWRVNNFRYDEIEGVKYDGANGQETTEPDWFPAAIQAQQQVRNSDSFKSAIVAIKESFKDASAESVENTLSRFVSELVTKLLGNIDSTPKDLYGDLMSRCLATLRQEPLKSGAEIKLDGVVMVPDKIKIGPGLILRKTTIADLEAKLPRAMFGPLHPFESPSAILRMEYHLPEPLMQEIQRRVEEAVCLLRLFRSASVNYSSYSTFSESLNPIGSATYSRQQPNPTFQKYVLTKEDEARLSTFWKNIGPVLPRAFYWPIPSNEDHTTIAYQRYSESLLEGGVIEKRTASAIMGLEALLLKPGGEQAELTYRLSNRVARMMNFFGHDPIDVRDSMKDAYKLRSLFAHGARLSHRDKSKLERQYENLENLFRSVADYLRICVIIFITMPLEKEAFIDLLDSSFLRKDFEEQLSRLVATAQNSVSLIS